MSEKKSKVIDFIRRNAYYLVIGTAILVIATVIAIILATNANRNRVQLSDEPKNTASVTDDKDKNGENKDDEKEKETDSKPSDGNEQKPDDKKDDEKPEEPKPTKITFTAPVENATVSKDYTSSTVVFNKTLGVYTGHMGLDFSADAGTKVKCAYAGTVESVTTSYLTGTTVTIDHGNGLKTVYNSIEVADGIVSGVSVSQGQELGEVSDNNRQEYKDGPHLHFEVLENGLKIDPETYLALESK
ncbi:MAG TPA: hypothetical protein DDW54_04475 [Clostridiales bacterium]|nr:hypothetical protein [Clostridiales bacterium]